MTSRRRPVAGRAHGCTRRRGSPSSPRKPSLPLCTGSVTTATLTTSCFLPWRNMELKSAPLINGIYYSSSMLTLDTDGHRGWGRSVTTPATRGLTGSTAVVLGDLHSFLASINASLQPVELVKRKKKKDKEEPIPPIFLLGHSMGATEVLYYMLNSNTFPPWIRGVLAYAPMVALNDDIQPPPAILTGARIAAKIRPAQQVRQNLDPYVMSRDTQVCVDWREDALCHNVGTLEGLVSMLDRSAWLEGMRSGYDLTSARDASLWIGHGTQDRVNEFEASKRFCEVVNVEDKTFKAYEGGYHKLHGEPDGMKEAFAKDIADWILARCGEGVKHRGPFRTQ